MDYTWDQGLNPYFGSEAISQGFGTDWNHLPNNYMYWTPSGKSLLIGVKFMETLISSICKQRVNIWHPYVLILWPPTSVTLSNRLLNSFCVSSYLVSVPRSNDDVYSSKFGDLGWHSKVNPYGYYNNCFSEFNCTELKQQRTLVCEISYVQ